MFTAAACAERAPTITLPPPVPIAEWAAGVDTLPGTYTMLSSPIDYWDSVLVVADVREQLLWRIQLDGGARDSLGSRGSGPGEFRRTGRLAKVHRDSVALLQGVTGMPFPVLSVATGRGRTVFLRREPTNPGMQDVLRSVAQPWLRFGDTLGDVYGAAMTHETQ